MPYNVLLLPLLGGYLFLHLIHYARFRSQALDGYRLLIESALAGVLLSGVSRVLLLGAALTLPQAAEINAAWDRLFPFPYSGTASGALVLGGLAPFLINPFYPEKRAKARAIRRDALFSLFHASVVRRQPIEVTLDNRKYYVGYLTESPNLAPRERYFSMLPIVSGCRDANDLSVRHVQPYESVYENPKLDRNNFAVILPVDRVIIARIFDQDAWREFAAQRARNAGAQA